MRYTYLRGCHFCIVTFRSAIYILAFLTCQISLAKNYLLWKYEKQLNKNELFPEFKYFSNVGIKKSDYYATHWVGCVCQVSNWLQHNHWEEDKRLILQFSIKGFCALWSEEFVPKVKNIFLSCVEGSDICYHIYFHIKTHRLAQFHDSNGAEVKLRCTQCSSAKKGNCR